MKAKRLKDALEKREEANLGNLFNYLQALAEALSGVVRWEEREEAAGQSVREDDLEHSYKTALLTIICAVMENARRAESEKLDIGLLATIALLHDIGEIEEGDKMHFEKAKNEAKERGAEVDAVKMIIAPLPDKAREYFIEAIRRAMPKTPDYIGDREARFFQGIERLGYIKRILHECRLGNLHFAQDKYLPRHIAALSERAEEFPSLKEWYEPYLGELENHLKEAEKIRAKLKKECQKNGGNPEDITY